MSTYSVFWSASLKSLCDIPQHYVDKKVHALHKKFLTTLNGPYCLITHVQTARNIDGSNSSRIPGTALYWRWHTVKEELS